MVHVCRSSISSHHCCCCYLLHFPWLLQSCRWRPQQLELWRPDDWFCRCWSYSLTVAGISGEKALHTPICSNWSVCLISGRHTSLDKINFAADSSLNFSVWKFFLLWKLECSCFNFGLMHQSRQRYLKALVKWRCHSNLPERQSSQLDSSLS